MSILDAATNDLALLINRLDLEASPGAPDVTPLKPSTVNGGSGLRPDDGSPTKRLAYMENPLKKGLRGTGIYQLPLTLCSPRQANIRASAASAFACSLRR
jgi:hypothetical protein